MRAGLKYSCLLCLRHQGNNPTVRRTLSVATRSALAIYRERKRVAEFPNLWIKEKLGLRRFRVRGLVKATGEAIWACLTYNIQQWVRRRWRPQLAAA